MPSSEEVITNLELNWRQVTADWCLFDPEPKEKFFNTMQRAERINTNEKVAMRETNAPVETDLFIQQLLWEKNSEFLCHMSPS